MSDTKQLPVKKSGLRSSGSSQNKVTFNKQAYLKAAEKVAKILQKEKTREQNA